MHSTGCRFSAITSRSCGAVAAMRYAQDNPIPYISQGEFDEVTRRLQAERILISGAGHFADRDRFAELTDCVLHSTALSLNPARPSDRERPGMERCLCVTAKNTISIRFVFLWRREGRKDVIHAMPIIWPAHSPITDEE